MNFRQRASKGGKYLHINSIGKIVEYTGSYGCTDNANFVSGNYFLPEDRDKAEKAVEEITAIYSKQLKP